MTSQRDHQVDPTLLQALRFRCIGPPRGGRVLAVSGHPTETATFYFGACAGGIWKTTDGGAYWQNISDGYLRSSAVGALTISEADPNVIYAGMGESTLRLDVSYGDGVYKSTDGGKSWRHVGLTETKHVSEIRVHPQNPDIVYVAALGHGFGPNPERGVYRSLDGGDTWELVLHKSENAGATDLAMDVTNPRILFASIYQVQRKFWTLSSGGPDSGLWRTTDSGDTWEEITNNKGLPTGIKGKIGVTISPANPQRVWAIIEAVDKKAGLYRSDDGGDTWSQVSDNRDLIHRPWYYCHVFADPQDADTVYVTNLKMWKSTDGGNNFTEITTPHGDNHDLWIDPTNPQRMIEGNDGGACVTFNGGKSWSTLYNQKTAQFYHVAVDSRTPYHVFGTQQDNSSIGVPSASEKGGIPWSDCYPAGTGESGYIVVHPDDSNIVFVGAIGSSPGGGNALQRYDHRTKQIRLITTWPEVYYGYGSKDMKYRFAWTYPIVFSPHDSNVLYTGGNHVFRTSDEGSSWEVVSPDLSRNDEEKLQPSGGPITLDTSGAETYGTVYAFAESFHEQGVLWAGTDDGWVHLSRDGGESWQNVTPPDLPEWALISMIEASHHNAATVFMAATCYKSDDNYDPYLYVTHDYGQNWTRLDSFPKGEITRCVREDPKQTGLLYVGTETGIFVSFNNGAEWQRLQNNLPIVPVYALVIKDDDLVVGTHGRSFWILDDVTPLRSIAADAFKRNSEVGAYLCAPKATTRHWLGWVVNMFRGPGKNYMMSLGASLTFTEEKNEYGERIRDMLDAGENPPAGVIVYYALPRTGNGTEGVDVMLN
ncbi:glycosyl hydrolase [Chloroflexi bacterium TSY]|nr:glycosyl hydrolase [Chloroflexi bacterium TSY]